MTITVLLNQKGGVGKSTLTVNLAAVTAEATQKPGDDKSVLAVSVDPQGSATWWAERVAEDELPFMMMQESDPRLLKRLPTMRQLTDIFIDTPGWLGTGEGEFDPMVEVLLDIADLVVVPMTPEPLSFDPTARTIQVVKASGKPYVVVINSFDARDGNTPLEETRALAEKKGWPVANTPIRKYRVHATAAAEGRVVTTYPANKTSHNAKSDFQNLALELSRGGWR